MVWNGERRGGSWTTTSSFAKAKSGRPNKQELENDKLLMLCPTRLYMGHRMQCSIRCGTCVHFGVCNKNPREDQDYCAMRPSKFVSKDELK